jgi:hypothetical protein
MNEKKNKTIMFAFTNKNKWISRKRCFNLFEVITLKYGSKTKVVRDLLFSISYFKVISSNKRYK